MRRPWNVRRALARTIVAIAVGATIGGAPPSARADGPPPVELPLQAGSSLTGTVESADATEVVVLVGPGSRRRVPWAQLAPLGVLRVRAALTKPDDGPGRLALASLASDLGLFAEARWSYRDISPFPLAFLYFDEGAMWMLHGDLERFVHEAPAPIAHLGQGSPLLERDIDEERQSASNEVDGLHDGLLIIGRQRGADFILVLVSGLTIDNSPFTPCTSTVMLGCLQCSPPCSCS